MKKRIKKIVSIFILLIFISFFLEFSIFFLNKNNIILNIGVRWFLLFACLASFYYFSSLKMTRRLRNSNLAIVNSLTDEKSTLIIVDYNSGLSFLCTTNSHIAEVFADRYKKESFVSLFSNYIEEHVHEEDKKLLKPICDLDYLANSDQKKIEIIYRSFWNNEAIFQKLSITKIVHGKKILGFSLSFVNFTSEYLNEHKVKTYRDILSSSTGYLEANLSKNKIIGDVIDIRSGDPKIVEFNELSKPYKYDDFEKCWCEKMLISGKKKFLSVSNCQYLLNAFEKGEHIIEVVFKSRIEDGSIKDSKKICYLSKNQIDGDIYCICILTDLTESMLKESEIHRTNMIIRSISDDYTAICYVDLDLDSMYDYRQDNMLTSWHEEGNVVHSYKSRVDGFAESFILPEDRELFKNNLAPEFIKSFLTSNDEITFDYRTLFKDKCFYYRAKIVRDKEISDKFCIIIGFKDISIEKEYLENLRRSNEKAVLASEAKSRFLFNMSHDMRTPMNAIMGFTSLAKRKLKQDEKATLDALDKIHSSGDILLKLINDILDLARIENGKLEICIEETNLEDCITLVHTLFDQSMGELNLLFNVSSNIKDKIVYCDSKFLSQIFINLLSNAQKFTPKGGSVDFSFNQVPCDKKGFAKFNLSVKDTGIGMSKDFLCHAFDSFERERTSTESKVQGTGLGLAIVKKLTEALGGKIECKSESGKGSEFIIDFCFEIYEKNKTIQNYTFDLEKCDFTGKKILLVEDNELNREISKELLCSEGIIVTEAENGLEALNIIKKSKEGDFDLILMDVQMPIMDGYSATKEIRKLSGFCEKLPIIAMTANAFDEDKQKSLNAGMNAHLAKPVKVSTLFETIARFVI